MFGLNLNCKCVNDIEWEMRPRAHCAIHTYNFFEFSIFTLTWSESGKSIFGVCAIVANGHRKIARI